MGLNGEWIGVLPATPPRSAGCCDEGRFDGAKGVEMPPCESGRAGFIGDEWLEMPGVGVGLRTFDTRFLSVEGPRGIARQ